MDGVIRKTKKENHARLDAKTITQDILSIKTLPYPLGHMMPHERYPLLMSGAFAHRL